MLTIRKIEPRDRDIYMVMVQDFYHSPAVLAPVPLSNMEAGFEEFCSDSPFTDAFMFEYEGEIVGFRALAYTYSQEAGGRVVWIEEIYLRPEHRGRGFGTAFIRFVLDTIPAKRYRLETEPDNVRAAELYRRCGFEHFEYVNYRLEP